MDRDQKQKIRSQSMQGTVLFVLGILTLIASLAIRSGWLGGVSAALLLPGGVMLYRVGKALS